MVIKKGGAPIGASQHRRHALPLKSSLASTAVILTPMRAGRVWKSPLAFPIVGTMLQRTKQTACQQTTMKTELVMAKILSSLMVLSMLAGSILPVAAQTRDDENGGDYFQYQQDSEGGGG